MEMTAVRTIAKPAVHVAEFFFDAANNPRWQKGMVSCEWTSEPPIGVGSRYEQKARFMGRDVTSTFIVTAFEPGRKFSIETVESTFPIQVTRSVEPIDDQSCRVRAVITGGPSGRIAKLVTPLIQGRAQRSVDADYDRLVELLEGDA